MAEMTSKHAANKENFPPSRHFNFDIDDDYFEIISEAFQPKNTQLSTLWGIKTFAAWVEERNKHKPHERCPENMLMTENVATHVYWLGRFVMEARR